MAMFSRLARVILVGTWEILQANEKVTALTEDKDVALIVGDRTKLVGRGEVHSHNAAVK